MHSLIQTKDTNPCSVHVSLEVWGLLRQAMASRRPPDCEFWILKTMLFIENCFHRPDITFSLVLLRSYLRINNSSSFMAWKQVTCIITLSLRMALVPCQGWRESSAGLPADLSTPSGQQPKSLLNESLCDNYSVIYRGLHPECHIFHMRLSGAQGKYGMASC